MASTLRVGIRVDIREIQRDLRAFGDSLDQPITDVLAQGAESIARAAPGFMRHGQPSWPTSSAARDFPGGVSAYYDSKASRMSANVGTLHPGAPVWEWGGDIHPAAGSAMHAIIKHHRELGASHQTIHIPPTHAVSNAGASQEDEIAQRLEDAIGRLAKQYGF